jgi:hypothetical protein
LTCTFAGGVVIFSFCIFDDGACEERKTEERYF